MKVNTSNKVAQSNLREVLVREAFYTLGEFFCGALSNFRGKHFDFYLAKRNMHFSLAKKIMSNVLCQYINKYVGSKINK